MEEELCVKDGCGHSYDAHDVIDDIDTYEPCLADGCKCWDFQPSVFALACGCLLVPAYAADGVREMQVHACEFGCQNVAALLQYAEDTGREVRIGEL